MKKTGKITALAAAAVLSVLSPIQVLAENPEFAHDAETWARLRDNIMEYDELQMLVEEYNPGYRNNQETYRDSKSSDDADDIRNQQYDGAAAAYDSAEELRAQAEMLKASGALAMPGMASAYSGLLSAAIMTEKTAMQTEQAAEASYRDSQIDLWDYQKKQAALVVQVQGQFASYNQLRQTVRQMEKNLELAEASHAAMGRKTELGMATQTDYLNSQKSLYSLQSTLTQTKASMESIHQRLCLNTGWAYNADPEIREVPRPDTARIAAMNPETDTAAAMDASYTRMVTFRGLENMTEGSAQQKNMERTLHMQEENIKAGMVSLYNDILQKETAYRLAQTALEAEEKTMNAVRTKNELGMISRLEYLQAESSLVGKQADAETAAINLQQAMETYDWALKGYMN